MCYLHFSLKLNFFQIQFSSYPPSKNQLNVLPFVRVNNFKDNFLLSKLTSLDEKQIEHNNLPNTKQSIQVREK